MVRVEAVDAPLDAPGQPEDAKRRIDIVDHGSLFPVAHRGARNTKATRDGVEAIGSEADFAHAFETVDRELRVPELALRLPKPAADRGQYAGIAANRHIPVERRPARLGRNLVLRDRGGAAPGMHHRPEGEKGQETQGRSIPRYLHAVAPFRARNPASARFQAVRQ